MKIEHQPNLGEKYVQIQAIIDKLKENLQIHKFINEELSPNTLLLQQKEALCQKIS